MFECGFINSVLCAPTNQPSCRLFPQRPHLPHSLILSIWHRHWYTMMYFAALAAVNLTISVSYIWTPKDLYLCTSLWPDGDLAIVLWIYQHVSLMNKLFWNSAVSHCLAHPDTNTIVCLPDFTSAHNSAQNMLWWLTYYSATMISTSVPPFECSVLLVFQSIHRQFRAS